MARNEIPSIVAATLIWLSCVCPVSAAVGQDHSIEQVFEDGEFNPHVPIEKDVVAIYGPGVVEESSDDRWLYYRLLPERIWVRFSIEASSSEDFRAVHEYLLTTLEPGIQRMAGIKGLKAPGLAGLELGTNWTSRDPGDDYRSAGTEVLNGVSVEVFEAFPFGAMDGTIHRAFVLSDVIVGLSVLVSE